MNSNNSVDSTISLTQQNLLKQSIEENLTTINLKCNLNIKNQPIDINSSYQMILKHFDTKIVPELLKAFNSAILSIRMKIESLDQEISCGHLREKNIQRENNLTKLITSLQKKDYERQQLLDEKEEQEHISTNQEEQIYDKSQIVKKINNDIANEINDCKERNQVINDLAIDNEDILFLREIFLSSIENELKKNKVINRQQYQDRLELETNTIIHQLFNIDDCDEKLSESIHKNNGNNKYAENDDNNIESNDLKQNEFEERINELKVEKRELKEAIETEKRRLQKKEAKKMSQSKSKYVFEQPKENKTYSQEALMIKFLFGLSIALAFLICIKLLYQHN